jgi:hypothetical protein
MAAPVRRCLVEARHRGCNLRHLDQAALAEIPRLGTLESDNGNMRRRSPP